MMYCQLIFLNVLLQRVVEKRKLIQNFLYIHFVLLWTQERNILKWKKNPKSGFFFSWKKTKRGGLPRCMGKIFLFSLFDTKLLDIDSNFLQGRGVSQFLPYAIDKFVYTVTWEKVLSTTDNAETGYVLKVGTNYTDKSKTCHSTFLLVQSPKYQ